jgi:hypothetical protein
MATNGRTNTRWRGEPLTNQIKDKEKKKHENPELHKQRDKAKWYQDDSTTTPPRG